MKILISKNIKPTKIIIIFVMLISVSCSEELKDSESIAKNNQEIIKKDLNKSTNLEAELKEDKVIYPKYQDTIIDNFIPEMSVSSIELLNAETVERLNKNLALIETQQRAFPYIAFLNDSKTEKLTLIFHYGGSINEFSEMELSLVSSDEEEVVLNIDRFKSGRGIELGMSKEEVKNILGEANINFPNKLRYRIVDVDWNVSDFLNKYKYPSYYVDAIFINNILVKYKFGFDYP